MNVAMGRDRQGAGSPWTPLRQPLYRNLWGTRLASDIGTWMHGVGAAWLMTSLSSSPLMVALVQSVTSAAMFLLALPAGAVADVVDRRRLLMTTEGWMLATAAVLGVLTMGGLVTPWLLLGLTFLLALGSAAGGPAWQATVPELVPRHELPAAIALGAIGINLARAGGPALGGLLVAAVGPGPVFLLNAASFLGVLAFLYRWRREPTESLLPAERFAGAMRNGLRYARHSPNLQAVLVQVGTFIFFASAVWALLPVFARQQLGRGSAIYGALLGLFGGGAVAGAVLLPRVRRHLSLNRLVAAASVLFAGGGILLAYSQSLIPAFVAVTLAGMAWLTMLSTLNTSAQMVLPGWVRARALSVYLLVFFGCMSAGSVLWGAVAGQAGVQVAFIAASLGMAASVYPLRRFRLQTGEGLDLSPSMHWPAPTVSREVEEDRGPALVTIEYRIEPGRAGEFGRAMGAVRRARMRTGSVTWGLYEDVSEPGRFLEFFMVESWTEHLRQHERVTGVDREVEGRARSFLKPGTAPIVTHYLAAPAPGHRGLLRFSTIDRVL